MTKYQKIVTAALAEVQSKFQLAEALATEIPSKQKGDGQQIQKEIRQARQDIIDAGGEPKSADTLLNYRATALWVKSAVNGRFRWVDGASFTAHMEASRTMSYADFVKFDLTTAREVRGVFEDAPASKDGPPTSVIPRWTPQQRADAVVEMIKDDPDLARTAAETLVSTPEGLDTVFRANAERPEVVEDRKQSHRRNKEQEAKEDEQLYHLRGFKALPVLWEAENLAEYIETKVARDPEDLAYARNAGRWLEAIGRRIVAWADGETVPMSDDDFAAEIESILEAGR